jgi:hypothetical protein
MSERLRHIESDFPEPEVTDASEVQPQSAEKSQDAKHETIDIDKTRERIEEIQNQTGSSSKTSPPEDTPSSRAFLPSLESATETLAKTLVAIRRNLTPSEKRFSKAIHDPIIETISEATAKTLARPYAILSGGVVACAGSSLYMYYTRHLRYRYNYFVPILLFFAGLIAGAAVEVLYKTYQHRRKRRS